MKRFEELKSAVDALESDFDKFYEKNNKAAGTRVRTAMQDLKKLAQEIRLEVQEIKNADK
ncbi:MAG: histone H1 [Flammeovirgaceae bacterium]